MRTFERMRLFGFVCGHWRIGLSLIILSVSVGFGSEQPATQLAIECPQPSISWTGNRMAAAVLSMAYCATWRSTLRTVVPPP